MPGMMDTILNLGLNDVAVEGLAAATGNPRFACDSYRRLIQMYGEVVDGVDGAPLRGGAAEPEGAARRHGRTSSSTADDLRELIATFKAIYERETGAPFPQDAREQLARDPRGLRLVGSPRARVYRRTYEIPDDLGTAVNVVQMVFGNKGDDVGHGRRASRATRRPASAALFGEFLVNAQGEDVVAGIRTPRADRARCASCSPTPTASCVDTLERLEKHYREMQDIEFTVEDGTLFLLQTRTGKRTRAGGAADRGRDGRRGPDHARGGASRGSTPASSTSCCTRRIDPDAQRRGRRDRASTPHRARRPGRSCSTPTRAEERGRAGEAVILVRWETTPDDIHGLIQRAGHPHRPRRHDLARRGRRARHGEALRRRLRGARRSTSRRAASRIGDTTLPRAT